MQNQLVEWTFASRKAYGDPFNAVRMDAILTEPDGTQFRVPGFWAGENMWRVRYASHKIGWHSYRTECSATADKGLHGVIGEVEIVAYTGDNPLYRHGPLCVAPDKRHFAHADGTPFFWVSSRTRGWLLWPQNGL